MKKKFPTSKKDAKKDEGKVLSSIQNLTLEMPLTIIPESVQYNANSELEIIFKGKIKLNELLLINEEFRKKIFVENQNYVDLFFLNKKYLYIYQVESKLNPASDLCASYTTKDFDINEDKLKPVNTIKTDSIYQIKVMQVEDNKHNNYVLKRCWISYKNGSKTEEELIEITRFLINKYTEFGVTKLFNACPYSAKPSGYHIIHLTNQSTQKSMLITEMLSLFAGNPLSDTFPVNNSSTILEYFIQILHAGNFLEAYKIEHNDIKPDNFLIEFVDKLALIKLIDFDIGRNQPQELSTDKSTGCRSHTAGYVAPEILFLIVKSGLEIKVQRQKLSQLNPWKSHSYSIGILMLQMIGFIPNMMLLGEFDPLKWTESDHNKILNKLNEYYNQENDLILNKIIFLINLCLLYNPEQRASVNEILTLIENMEQNDLNSLKKEWKKIYEKRKPSRTILKAQLEELKTQINSVKIQNQYFIEERNKLINSLNDQFPDININNNDNLSVKTRDIINKIYNSFEKQKKMQDDEVSQLRNALDKGRKENVELLNQNELMKNHLVFNTKELEEYQKNSAIKDTQIQALDPKILENQDLVTIPVNKIKNLEIENDQLKKELNDLKLKMDELKTNLKILSEEGHQYLKKLDQKDQIIEEITKENIIQKEKLNSDKANSNQKSFKINQSNEVKIEKQEVTSKLINEVEHNETFTKSILLKFDNFNKNILKIIQEKGFKILTQSDPFDEILYILKRFLHKDKTEDMDSYIKNTCTICDKIQTYDEMKNCIIFSQKFNYNIIQEIKENDQVMNFNNLKFKIDEMIILKPLIIISNRLELIHFGNNSEFNAICLEILIEAINLSQSLKTIILYKNHNDIQINHYLTILETTKKKKNMICLYLDKNIITEKKAKSICNQNEMKIDQWGSKND